MLKHQLKALLEAAILGSAATFVDQTLPDQSEYLDYQIAHPDLPGGALRVRFFIWELTPDNSAAGRLPGEHKIQLTLGEASDTPHNFPADPERINVLLGYSELFDVFVGFQIELHKNFAWSALVACRAPALLKAHGHGWATHLKGRSPKTGLPELAIAFSPPRMIDWLRFEISHSGQFGSIRKDAANEWILPHSPISPAPGLAATNISAATLPEPAPSEIIVQDELLNMITDNIELSLGAATIMVEVNVADRIAATNRHNEIVCLANNHAFVAFGAAAIVIHRDLPGHQYIHPGIAARPDLGIRYPVEAKSRYLLLEAKSLPVDTAGQWQQVVIGIGELARYSAAYDSFFDEWPVRVLALEFLPIDDDLRTFLRDLNDNEGICVIWRKGDVFGTFPSHDENILWLAQPLP